MENSENTPSSEPSSRLPGTPPQYQQPPLNAPPRQTTSKRSDGFRNIMATVAVLVAAPIIALFITGFLFQSYEVFGPSMESTLQNGDRLIVVKAPRTWAKLRHKTFMPKRGQIVIFTKLDLFVEGGDGTNKQLIKRVIALPGERVNVKNGVLTVYNNEHPDGYQPDKGSVWANNIPVATPIDGDWTVQKGQVFVCGDNRVNSLDSRTFGPIDTKEIVGNAAFRFLPLNQSQTFK